MSEEEKVAGQIIDAIVDAVTVVAPLTGTAAPALVLISRGIRALYSLAEQLGHGPDAVQAALDAELAAGRQATDAALAKKHGAA